MSHVRYIGASIPHQEQVLVGTEQQLVTVTKASQVFTFSDAVGTYLVTHEPSLWEAAEGWTPPPGSPVEETTTKVTSAYTLGPLCTTLFADPTAASFEVEVPPASEYKGAPPKTIINPASNGNTVTLKSQGGNIVVPGKTGATTTLVIGAGLTYTAVTISSDGTNWHVS